MGLKRKLDRPPRLKIGVILERARWDFQAILENQHPHKANPRKNKQKRKASWMKNNNQQINP